MCRPRSEVESESGEVEGRAGLEREGRAGHQCTPLKPSLYTGLHLPILEGKCEGGLVLYSIHHYLSLYGFDAGLHQRRSLRVVSELVNKFLE